MELIYFISKAPPKYLEIRIFKVWNQKAHCKYNKSLLILMMIKYKEIFQLNNLGKERNRHQQGLTSLEDHKFNSPGIVLESIKIIDFETIAEKNKRLINNIFRVCIQCIINKWWGFTIIIIKFKALKVLKVSKIL